MVHHGGGGSTAAAARAGIPSFAVPFGYEQGLWGRRIADLGIGVAPVFAEKLTVPRLASAIRRVTADARIRIRAQELAARIRAEDGVRRAVEIIAAR
jgi:UDP:flavonoid glycosyltransferase YjiC (YdhE family)